MCYEVMLSFSPWKLMSGVLESPWILLHDYTSSGNPDSIYTQLSQLSLDGIFAVFNIWVSIHVVPSRGLQLLIDLVTANADVAY